MMKRKMGVDRNRLVIMLILCVSCPVCPVATLISPCCPAIVVLMDNWGCMAVAGVVSRGMGIPCWTAASIWGRIGLCSVNGLLPWRVAMWWIPPASTSSSGDSSMAVWSVGLKCSGLT